VRELSAPPFEVTEKGWGEFEAAIRIVWRDPCEKAIVLTHGIKLYPPIVPGTKDPPVVTTNNKEKEVQPVLHEVYDEVVFTNPTETFYKQLMKSNKITPKIYSHEASVQESFKSYSDENDFKTLLEAQKFLHAELGFVKERILRAEKAKEELEEAIADSIAQSKNASGIGNFRQVGSKSKLTGINNLANSKKSKTLQ